MVPFRILLQEPLPNTILVIQAPILTPAEILTSARSPEESIRLPTDIERPPLSASPPGPTAMILQKFLFLGLGFRGLVFFCGGERSRVQLEVK